MPTSLAPQPQDPTALLDASERAAKAATGDDWPTVDLFMLYHAGHYSKTLLCREQASELANFMREAMGVEVGLKQVRIGFSICHAADVAEGWIDDALAMDDSLAVDDAGRESCPRS